MKLEDDIFEMKVGLHCDFPFFFSLRRNVSSPKFPSVNECMTKQHTNHAESVSSF